MGPIICGYLRKNDAAIVHADNEAVWLTFPALPYWIALLRYNAAWHPLTYFPEADRRPN